MPDVFTKEQRSKVMSHIRGKNNKPETAVRKYLWHHGFRYYKNDRNLPGTPDIVIPKYRTVIFINGCFWHHHYGCKYARYPKSRTEYWIKHINKNVENDIKNYNLLQQMDYNVITVWECEIKEDFEHRMKLLIEEIKNSPR